MTNVQKIETVDTTISKLLEEQTLLDFIRDSLNCRDDIPYSEAVCYILRLVSDGISEIADGLDHLLTSLRKSDRSGTLPELIAAV